MYVASTNDKKFPLVIRNYLDEEVRIDYRELKYDSEWKEFLTDLIHARKKYLEKISKNA